MNALVVVALAGLATYALRVAPIVALTRYALPAGVDRALGYATPAVLAGLAATSVTQGGGVVALVAPSPPLLAAVVAGVAMWRTGNLLATIAGGMGTFWLLSSLWP